MKSIKYYSLICFFIIFSCVPFNISATEDDEFKFESVIERTKKSVVLLSSNPSTDPSTNPEHNAMCSGVVQHYISKCIVGGRCMTNSNKMYHVKRKLADFDACSLYPSAMNRMKGYLIGTPKVLNTSQLNYNFVSSQDGYFIIKNKN